MKKIFGDLYSKAFEFESSRKEKEVSSSEDWSAAVLSGSDATQRVEEPVRRSFSRLLIGLTGIIAVILGAQLFNLQIVNGEQNQHLANGNSIRQTVIPAPRGVIYDNAGNLLVENLANFQLVATPSLLAPTKSARTQIYQTIATILNVDPASIQKTVESNNKGGLTSSTPVIVADKIPRDQALLLDEQSRQLIGFTLDTNPSRNYLDGGNLSQFLGYIGRVSPQDLKTHPDYRPTDDIGKSGLESFYESDLRGKAGEEQTEVDAAGKPVRLLASVDPTPGNNLVLSINKTFEAKAAAILAAGVQKANATAGVVVAMNPSNGQILAAVNYPSYDNNLFAAGISAQDYQGLLNNPGHPLFNRITQGSYPIGSTIKPLIASAALQTGTINASSSVDDTGQLAVTNIYNPSIVQIFHGWKPGGLGLMNVVSALEWSSDIFFYTVGGGFGGFHGVGITQIDNFLAKFGFGKPTGIDLPSESAGFVPSPANKLARLKASWTVGDTYNVSIGQGDLLVTPLQLLDATAAIANGGTLYKPQLVHEIKSADGKTIRTIAPVVTDANFISPANLALVRQGMAEAVASGTACCSIKSTVPVPVAGKTGTAETSTQDPTGTGATTQPHAWFTAFAPIDNPQIAVVVLVEHGGEGASFAVPIARDVLQAYFAH